MRRRILKNGWVLLMVGILSGCAKNLLNKGPDESPNILFSRAEFTQTTNLALGVQPPANQDFSGYPIGGDYTLFGANTIAQILNSVGARTIPASSSLLANTHEGIARKVLSVRDENVRDDEVAVVVGVLREVVPSVTTVAQQQLAAKVAAAIYFSTPGYLTK